MIRLLYISRFKALAVLLLMLFALANVKAQDVVYQGVTTHFEVNQMPGDSYEWELYSDSTVNFAQVPGVSSASYANIIGSNNGARVDIEWKLPGTYFYKVTATSSCTNNLQVGKIKVLPSLPVATPEINPVEICEGETAELIITFEGKAPWEMKLQTKNIYGTTITSYSVDAADNPLKINVNPLVTTEYSVVEVSNEFGVQNSSSKLVKLTVHKLPDKTPIYLKKP